MPTDGRSISERLVVGDLWSVEVSEVARNWAIVVGGGLGIAVAIWRGWAASQSARASRQQAKIAQRQHVAELFSKAVEQLSDNRADVRLSAVYTLRRIAEDFPEYRVAVGRLLQLFIRRQTEDVPEVGAEVQEALGFVRSLVRRSGRDTQ